MGTAILTSLKGAVVVMVGVAPNASEMVGAARRAAGMTQQQLADRLGTTQSVISRWERGHDEPRLSTLAAIARATGRRLHVELVDDGVDRAQIRQQLALTPAERIEGQTVPVAALHHIIRSKEAAGRPKDRAVLPILYALREEIERDS